MSSRRFAVWLGVIALLAFAWRLWYAWHFKWDAPVNGDAFYFHTQANGIVDGHGFARFLRTPDGRTVLAGASADHPPLYPLYLAAWSLLGARSAHWHIVANIVVGAATVVVCGVLGREVRNARTGLLAAGVAAAYVSLWIQEAELLSEPITALLCALVLWATYRAWRAPTRGRVAVAGLLAGLAALTRAEVVLYAAIVTVAFVVARRAEWRHRLLLGALGGAIAVAVVAPWVIRNMTAFHHPLYLSGGAEITLAVSNCESRAPNGAVLSTYSGVLLAWWNPACGYPVPPGDASDRARAYRKRADAFIRAHERQLPKVVAARLGRMWEVFRPGNPFGALHTTDTLSLELIEGRDAWHGRFARIGLVQYYALAVLAVAGALALRRHAVPLVPMLGMVVIASVAAVLAFGNTRYRVPAEIPLVVLAAVGVDALVAGRRTRRREPA